MYRSPLTACLLLLFCGSLSAQLLVNELKVNPPGADNPFEYIELKGTPGTTLVNMYFVIIEGDPGSAGNCDLVIPLSGITLGENGLIFIGTSLGYHNLPAATVFKDTLIFAVPGGYLENGSATYLTVFSPSPIVTNANYDPDGDGQLNFPFGASIQDAVGWTNGSAGAKVFGGVALTQSSGTPDAAVRFFGNNTPFSVQAWYCGDLLGNDPTTLAFDPLRVSTNHPGSEGMLSPGDHNLPNALSVEKTSNNNKIAFFRSGDQLWWEWEQIPTDPVHAALFDLQGKLVWQFGYGAVQQGGIDLLTTLSGMYLLRLQTGDQVHVHRFAVSR